MFHVLGLSFFFFRLDYLQVSEPSESSEPHVWRFCGTNITSPLISKGHTLKLHFKSDATVSNKGFKINYRLLGMLIF